jgi:outer membrane protein assembly factor BamB
MVWDGDLAYASGGYPERETLAVRTDGSGEIVWRNREKCYEQSILAHDGYVYAMNDSGIALCWNARTGEEMWKTRLGGPISASPILAAGHVYCSNEKGTTFVFRADPQRFELVAENQLGEEAFATPTICDNCIFLRVASGTGETRQEMLYCLAKRP